MGKGRGKRSLTVTGRAATRSQVKGNWVSGPKMSMNHMHDIMGVALYWLAAMTHRMKS